ncbi:MAG: hypothetical protein AABX66_00005 [Nanoarchaeota archaeon]
MKIEDVYSISREAHGEISGPREDSINLYSLSSGGLQEVNYPVTKKPVSFNSQAPGCKIGFRIDMSLSEWR